MESGVRGQGAGMREEWASLGGLPGGGGWWVLEQAFGAEARTARELTGCLSLRWIRGEVAKALLPSEVRSRADQGCHPLTRGCGDVRLRQAGGRARGPGNLPPCGFWGKNLLPEPPLYRRPPAQAARPHCPLRPALCRLGQGVSQPGGPGLFEVHAARGHRPIKKQRPGMPRVRSGGRGAPYSPPRIGHPVPPRPAHSSPPPSLPSGCSALRSAPEMPCLCGSAPSPPPTSFSTPRNGPQSESLP